MIYALDTNIVSYLLRGNEIVERNFYRNIILAGNHFVIPPIAVYELLRWLKYNPTPKHIGFLEEFQAIYSKVKAIAVMLPDAWEKAAEIHIALKRKARPIGDADIFIAAYCIVNDYTLVTNNTRHFENIDGLKYVNWCDSAVAI